MEPHAARGAVGGDGDLRAAVSRHSETRLDGQHRASEALRRTRAAQDWSSWRRTLQLGSAIARGIAGLGAPVEGRPGQTRRRESRAPYQQIWRFAKGTQRDFKGLLDSLASNAILCGYRCC